jgi:hypothetical protein
VAIVPVVRPIRAIQYDGTNSSDILDWIGSCPDNGAMPLPVEPEIGSEGDGVLVVHYDDSVGGSPLNVTINEGDWVLEQQGGYGTPMGGPGQVVPDDALTGVVPLSTLTNAP